MLEDVEIWFQDEAKIGQKGDVLNLLKCRRRLLSSLEFIYQAIYVQDFGLYGNLILINTITYHFENYDGAKNPDTTPKKTAELSFLDREIVGVQL